MGMDSSGNLFWTNSSHHAIISPWLFLLIPPAWSISIELVFYLLAPFLVRLKNFHLASIMIVSLILKLGILNSSLNIDPWDHRFMPAELLYFIIGIFCYRFYSFLKTKEIPRILLITPFAGMILATMFFQYIPSHTNTIRFNLYLAALIVSLPFIFLYTRRKKWDQWLGEFTYPVYLIHFFVIGFISKLLVTLSISDSYLSEISLLISLIVSYILFTFISQPIERFRQKRIH